MDRRQNNSCIKCGNPTANLRCVCMSLYCSEACQHQDWATHKLTCQQAQRTQAAMAQRPAPAPMPPNHQQQLNAQPFVPQNQRPQHQQQQQQQRPNMLAQPPPPPQQGNGGLTQQLNRLNGGAGNANGNVALVFAEYDRKIKVLEDTATLSEQQMREMTRVNAEMQQSNDRLRTVIMNLEAQQIATRNEIPNMRSLMDAKIAMRNKVIAFLANDVVRLNPDTDLGRVPGYEEVLREAQGSGAAAAQAAAQQQEQKEQQEQQAAQEQQKQADALQEEQQRQQQAQLQLEQLQQQQVAAQQAAAEQAAQQVAAEQQRVDALATQMSSPALSVTSFGAKPAERSFPVEEEEEDEESDEDDDDDDDDDDAEEEDMLCPVCLSANTDVLVMPCFHRVCSSCGDAWRKRASTCPSCNNEATEYIGTSVYKIGQGAAEFNKANAPAFVPLAADAQAQAHFDDALQKQAMAEDQEAAMMAFRVVSPGSSPNLGAGASQASWAATATAAAATPRNDSQWEQVGKPKKGAVETSAAAAAGGSPVWAGGRKMMQTKKWPAKSFILKPGQSPHREHPLWKTMMCRHHDLGPGRCQNTKRNCPFAHGKSDLLQRPLSEDEVAAAEASDRAKGGPKNLWKTSMCQLKRGKACSKPSKDCKYAHGVDELRPER